MFYGNDDDDDDDFLGGEVWRRYAINWKGNCSSAFVHKVMIFFDYSGSVLLKVIINWREKLKQNSLVSKKWEFMDDTKRSWETLTPQIFSNLDNDFLHAHADCKRYLLLIKPEML